MLIIYNMRMNATIRLQRSLNHIVDKLDFENPVSAYDVAHYQFEMNCALVSAIHSYLRREPAKGWAACGITYAMYRDYLQRMGRNKKFLALINSQAFDDFKVAKRLKSNKRANKCAK